MSPQIVIDAPAAWSAGIAGARVLSCRAYLGGGAADTGAVFNLCAAERYQSPGYYVSLLAEARGQTAWPPAGGIEDMRYAQLLPLLTADLGDSSGAARAVEFLAAFGECRQAACAEMAKRLFARLRAPLLAVRCESRGGRWRVTSLRLPGLSGLSPTERDFVGEAALRYFGAAPSASVPAAYRLAILHDPTGRIQPSNGAALAHFAAAARAFGLDPEFISPGDAGRIADFDALFIRDTTFLNHYTYRFSRQAAAAGMVVLDDPVSILRCNNKVYLAEMLDRLGLPAPATVLLHPGNVDAVLPALPLPCVLKQPDSSFSVGVERCDTRESLRLRAQALLADSELVVAQEWLPTDFDWRVGVLDGRVAFVCKYHMVEGHWQVVRHAASGAWQEGRVEAVPVETVPRAVVDLAVAAAAPIGQGFYGVDIKEVGGRCCVIEVNDNPNVDAGNEDGVRGPALYAEVMGLIRRRLDERARGGKA